MTRYRIIHRTTYVYSDTVSSSYGRGYLTPRELPHQHLRSHRINVEPTPSDQSSGYDGYGNIDAYFHVTTAHRQLVVTSESTVELSPPASLGDRLDEPWEAARPLDAGGNFAVEFQLDLAPPEITSEVRAYAAVSFPPGRPLGEAIEDLNGRIFTDFTYRSGSTTVSTRVEDVLRAGSGVCQDFARLAIACLRSVGLAGRYVSGYLSTDPPPGKERMIGVDATHAWVGVWVSDDLWLEFDPTNDQFVDERYITVAWGRDYADVPPLRGVIFTDAKESTIAVSVDVAPLHEGGTIRA